MRLGIDQNIEILLGITYCYIYNRFYYIQYRILLPYQQFYLVSARNASLVKYLDHYIMHTKLI